MSFGRSIIPEPLARQPWGVLLPLTALALFGATVLYSAAGGSLRPWAAMHFLRFLAFLAMAMMLARVRRDRFKQVAYPLYGGLMVLLVLVEAIGRIGGGSQRWLNLGFITLQPSELMKPAIVLVLARFYDALPPAVTGSWRALVPALALMALPAALVIIQPDLGTALAICFGAIVVIFLAGIPLRWFIGAGLAAGIAAPIAFFALLH
ncbi:MAG: FtsW/RodA/SpoVE family cell cycle protein, partial [Novosphingobium sp.]|nr:FtsW/RodA/SpoVE family cell cycle protein [Novosphingobium sp.]